jgi:hypothetical protein
MSITKDEARSNRDAAKKAGEKTYVGRPCRKGHDGLRYVSSGCVECAKSQSNSWARANAERRGEIERNYRTKNIEVTRERYRKNSGRRAASWTPVEKIARKSVADAIKRGAIFDPSKTFSQVVAEMIALAEERLDAEASTGVPHEIDHVVPIAAHGCACASNAQVITMVANRSKGNKSPFGFTRAAASPEPLSPRCTQPAS